MERESLTATAHRINAFISDERSFGRDSDNAATILWRRDADKVQALIAGHTYATRQWIEPVSNKQGARIWIGPTAEKQDAVYRTAGATGLPWSVAVAVNSPDAILDSLTGRRNLLLAGLLQ